MRIAFLYNAQDHHLFHSLPIGCELSRLHPEHDVVVVDEAHEVTARITQAATDELSVSDVERAARRAQRHVKDDQADDLDDAAGALEGAIAGAAAGRMDRVPRTSRTRWCWCATRSALVCFALVRFCVVWAVRLLTVRGAWCVVRLRVCVCVCVCACACVPVRTPWERKGG